jgi:hypothetical protein
MDMATLVAADGDTAVEVVYIHTHTHTYTHTHTRLPTGILLLLYVMFGFWGELSRSSLSAASE